jgi:hypothetical protein
MEETDIVFTRYLYIKQEVKLALLASLLNKKDDALFWAYELYYSGFVYELFETLFKIYYDFYATLNEGFESYLLKKTKDVLKKYNNQNRDDRCVGSIIRNFLNRPFNTDVFMLQNMCNMFEVDCGINKDTQIQDLIRLWIKQNNYWNISQFVLNELGNYHWQPKEVYSIVLDAFAETAGLQINKSKQMINFTRSKIVNIDDEQVLLARIMELFAKKHALTMGKNKYSVFDTSENILYETLEQYKDGIKNYNILQHACKLGINDEKYLGLFDIGRNKLSNDALKSMYNSSWTYYASWSPFWNERINSCDGKCDHMSKKVVFDDDDLFDTFHDNYDYEPDEQPLFVKNKCITTIEDKLSWSNFYERHKNNSLFKLDDTMLAELCQHKIKYVK